MFCKGQLSRRNSLSEDTLPFRTSGVPVPSRCSDDVPDAPEGDVLFSAEGVIPIKKRVERACQPPTGPSKPPVRRCPRAATVVQAALLLSSWVRRGTKQTKAGETDLAVTFAVIVRSCKRGFSHGPCARHQVNDPNVCERRGHPYQAGHPHEIIILPSAISRRRRADGKRIPKGFA
jgi:hypothetical protein